MKFSSIVATFSIVLFAISCEPEDDLVPDNNGLPTISTYAVKGIFTDTAVAGGVIIANGGNEIKESGVCWGEDPIPTNNTNFVADSVKQGSFTSVIRNMKPGTVYYVSAYAKNANGIAYGESVPFSTSFKDQDGHIYHTVKIGTQLWAVENLRATHYRNGDEVATVTTLNNWFNATEGLYCAYGFENANIEVYGLLYNHKTISDTRKICPVGWRLPTYKEWKTLTDGGGGDQVAGNVLKGTGTTYWTKTTADVTNKTGFTALPAGIVSANGFLGIGTNTYMWAADAEELGINIVGDSPVIAWFNNKADGGNSIRLIKE
ncbi:fibrobacter succinogenes major paralogous domain-containing protein [Chitinophaga sancti]|uniref:fibrobacter succinogenes major paralogous domain-containing protein n=1 Tax=Chitinophaga sancti TaxID=1004 RepID=UPI003F790C46